MIPLPTVVATAVVTKAPARFAAAEISTAGTGRERPRPDPRRDVVRRVVEAVREVERQRDRDNEDEKDHVVSASAVLDDDRLEHVRGGFAGVHGFLEALVDVFQRITSSGSARAMKRLETLS
jgi:hypothetical protein